VYPQETQGPFYLNLDLLRSDITDGKEGTPLAVTIQVVRGSSCTPVKDAAVDIWHCDAAGVYSGYPGQLGGLDTTGEKFLRGTQVTDAQGRVTFQTIYPGWYPGRTTHIHFKVHVTSTSEATSQLYFPEDVNADVYTVAPYSAHGQKDTSNAADGVALGNLPPLLVVTKTNAGYEGTLVVTVAG
jgi:protocatechuate 3,4-dioxygenase beta subunit